MASFARLLMVLVGLLASADLGHAKVFERCELANELRSRGVSEKQLADWVCLAYHESRYDTAAVGRLNWDQSVDHGLFQISDIYWCDWSSDEPDRQYKNVCNNNCNSFRDDDIGDDLTCVMKIHKEHQRLQGNGFLAWVAWKQHCQHSDLSSYVSGCDRVTTSTTQRPTTTTTTTTRRPTATGRPSVQDFYRNPSKTNAHTHFNNLAPLANLLVRGARPQKGRLQPYVRQHSGAGGSRRDDRVFQPSEANGPFTSQSSPFSANPFARNVFLGSTDSESDAVDDHPHPFADNIFLTENSDGPASHPFKENVFLNGDRFSEPETFVTERPRPRSTTTRRPPSDSFIPLWSGFGGKLSEIASRPKTAIRPTFKPPKTTRRPNTTRRPMTTRRLRTSPPPTTTVAPRTTRKSFTPRRFTTRAPLTTRRFTTRAPLTTRKPRTTLRPKTTRRPKPTRRSFTTTRRPSTHRPPGGDWIHLWPVTTRRPNSHAWSTPLTTYRPSIFDKNGNLRVTPSPWPGR